MRVTVNGNFYSIEKIDSDFIYLRVTYNGQTAKDAAAAIKTYEQRYGRHLQAIKSLTDTLALAEQDLAAREQGDKFLSDVVKSEFQAKIDGIKAEIARMESYAANDKINLESAKASQDSSVVATIMFDRSKIQFFVQGGTLADF